MATTPAKPGRLVPTEVPEDEMVACAVCLAEIPKSVAKSDEGTDYVHHFCGLDCLQQWRAQGGKAKNSSKS